MAPTTPPPPTVVQARAHAPDEQLRQWQSVVQARLPALSRTQARALAAFSMAAAVLRSASLLRCAGFTAIITHAPLCRLRQRLRDLYLDASAKRGLRRRSLDVDGCFGELATWALSLVPTHSDVVIALDPSLCRDRLACVCVSLITPAGAVPIAWRVVEANKKGGAYLPSFVCLLGRLAPALAGRRVYVLTDRGLFSPVLFRAIRAQRWHPLMRVARSGYWHGKRRRVLLSRLLTCAGERYAGRGHLHGRTRLPCTLVATWSAPYQEPLLVVTDEPPSRACASRYRLRFRIEQVFRAAKSDVFGWERSRIGAPSRAERVWLIYAVGLLRLLHLGERIDEVLPGLLVRSDVDSARGGRRLSRRLLGQWVAWALVLGLAAMPQVDDS